MGPVVQTAFRTGILIMVMLQCYIANACNKASATLISTVNNGNGTYTITINVCMEMLGLEGPSDHLSFTFSGATIASYAPASFSTSTGDVYNSSLASGNTVLNYITTSPFIAHCCATMCNNFTITTNGLPSQVVIDTHVGYPSGVCVKTITFCSPPTVTITGPNTICTGGSTTLDAGAGYSSYSWSNSGGSNQTATFTSAGTYTVTVTNAAGCTGTASFTVTASPNPTTNITGPTSYCQGSSVTLNAGSGFSSYAWSPGGGSGQTITANSPGTYTVTVTNAAGCTGVDTHVITEVPNPTPTITGPPALCTGATITLNAGSGYSNYAWSPSGSGQNLNVTAGGTYTVTVTNASGCTGVASFTVTQNPNPTTTIVGPNSFCAGGSTTLDAGAGFSSYAWSNSGGSNQTATFSSAGTFTVTVTNASGCTGTASLTVTQNPNPTPTITGPASLCTGSTITLNAGAGFNTYDWGGGNNSQTFTVSTAGTYAVTVTNASGCTGTDNQVVTESPNPAPTITGNAAICSGASTVLNAGPGYSTYAWSPSGNTQTITANSAGNYTVTVTNSAGCTGTASFSVTSSPNPVPVITGANNFCSGGSTTLDAGPGFSTYSWSNSGGSNQTATYSSAGTFTVTVTNAEGCTGVASLTVAQNPNPVPNITGPSTFCTGASVTLNAGSGFNSYSWTGGGNSQNITVNSAGTYVVTVTNAAGCTGTDSQLVTEIPNPTPTISGTNAICAGATTTLSATPGFTSYAWSPSGNTASITVNSAGTYTVTVTNASGCTGVATETVALNPAPTTTITGNNAICAGSSTTLDAGPGFSSYAWSNGGGSAQTATFSAAGTYTVTVTNSFGCTGTASFGVTLNPNPTPSISGPNTFCAGSSITLNAGSGYAAYAWSGAAGNNQTTSISTPGTYGVTVTNAVGCTGSASITVTEIPLPTPTISGNNAFCSGSNTTLSAGSGYASYLWSNASILPNITVNSPGTYTVTVTNAAGCTGSATQTVNQNPNPAPQISGSTTFCVGSTTTLDAGAGYSAYQWSNANNGQSITVGTPGNYTVTVTDNNGCTGSATVTVTQSTSLNPQIAGTPQFCSGNSTTLDAGSGFASYLWTGGAATQTLTVNAPGLYSVTVTGLTGCTGTATVTVTQSPNPTPSISGNASFCEGGSTVLNAGAGFSTYAWTGGIGGQILNVTSPGTYTVTVSNAAGCTGTDTQVVTQNSNPTPTISGNNTFCQGASTVLDAGAGYNNYVWAPGGAVSQTLTVNTPGTYLVTVTNSNGCTGTASFSVNQTANPVPNITGAAAFCTGSSVTLDAGNGFSSYNWSIPGNSNQTISVTAAGTYSVTVTNAAGCTGTDTQAVIENQNPVPNINGNASICAGSTTTLDAGAGFVSYAWSTGSPTQTIQVNQGGNFTVVVTNANGCTGTDNFVVTQNQNPAPQIAGSTTFCVGSSTTLDAGAGYTNYLWSNAEITPLITVNTPGTYAVTVTNSNGCTGQSSITVTQSTSLNPQIAGPTEICAGTTATLNTGTGFSTYTWSNASNLPTTVVSSSGIYTVTVTDASGCSGTATHAVTVVNNPVTTISGNTAICSGASTTLDAGNGFSSYLWSTGSIDQTINVNAAGNFSVVVSNAAGCTATANIAVTLNPNPNPVISGSSTFCVGTTTTLDAGAGYSNYLWSNAANTATIDVSLAGTYSVTVTNAQGCTGTASLQVTVSNSLNPQISGPTQFCQGSSVTLDAGSNFASYQWSNAGNTSSITVTTGGTFTVTVSDASGCTGTATHNVVQANNPVPTISGTNQICSGETAILDAGSGFTSYAWASGEMTQVLNTTTSGTYSVVVTNAAGCTGTDNFIVNVNPNPAPQISGSSSFCTGGFTTLDAGSGFATYLWSNAGATSTITVNTAGLYLVTVTSALGCTGTAQISVIESTSLNPQISGPGEVCPGGTIQLNAGSGFANYQWSNSGNSASISVSTPGLYTVTVSDASGCSGTASQSVTLAPVPNVNITGDAAICAGTSTLLDAGNGFASYLWNTGNPGQTLLVNAPGTYSVTVSNAQGCTNSNSLTITQNPGLQPQIIGSNTFCIGSSSLLDAGAGYASYLWSNNSVSQTITVTTAGTYAVTVTDANGCTGTSSMTVSASTSLNPQISGPTQFCPGNSITLNAGAGYANYMWSNAGNGASITVTTSGTYTVTVSDATGCTGTDTQTVNLLIAPTPAITGSNQICAGNSTILDAGTGFAQYNWASGQSTQTISVNTAGNYSVVVTNTDGCTGTASFSVSVSPNPNPALSGSDHFCAGNSTTLSVTGNFTAYNWSNGGNSATNLVNTSGNFTVTVTDAAGCTGTASLSVTEAPGLTPQISGAAQFCAGNSSLLDAGTGYSNYLWSDGSNSQTLLVSTPGTFTVTVSDATGCTGIAALAVAQTELIPLFTATQPTCGGNSNGAIQINSVTGGTGTYSYNLNGNSSVDGNFSGLGTGNYTLEVSDASGCSWTETIELVEPIPGTVDAGEDREIQLGTSTLLVGETNLDPNAIDNISWTPDFELNCPTCLETVAKPYENQEYTLTIVDTNGCIISDRVLITVKKQVNVYIPNVFSPNGDNANDVFGISVGDEVKSINAYQIYDRWGELLYSAENLDLASSLYVGWDGTFHDKPLNPGVYVYVIEIEFNTGKKVLYKGDVTLVR